MPPGLLFHRRSAAAVVAATLTLLVFSPNSWAARPEPEMVKDIRPVVPGLSSSPQSFVTSGTVTYFLASTASTGQELWITDGTAAGTALVKDINPGSSSSSISKLTFVGDTLFFVATPSLEIGAELWVSDGTETGTVLVKNINSSFFNGSSINSVVTAPAASLTSHAGMVYFSANDGVNGTELWESDGTEAGTRLVKDIRPAGSSMTVNHLIVESGGKLFFSANDGTSGTELWVLDRSTDPEAEPEMIEIRPTSLSSSPRNGTDFQGTLYFAAAGSTAGGNELWKSDGTPAGTVQVAEIREGGSGLSTNSDPSLLTRVQDTLFFTANTNMAVHGGALGVQLWKVDGGTGAASLVKNIRTGGAAISNLAAVGDSLFFLADADSGASSQAELWVSDGADAGTTLVQDINPGVASGSSIGPIFDVAGTAFFRAFHDSYGTEIWKSDGTDSGTTIVTDIEPGSTDGTPSTAESGVWWGARQDKLIFAGKDATLGTELWTADASSGAEFLADLNGGGGDSHISFEYGYEGNLFFQANDGTTGAEPHFSGGTSESTYLLRNIHPTGDSSTANFAAVNGVVTFLATDGSAGQELWKTDGTPEGTELLKDINPGSPNSQHSVLGLIGNTLFLNAANTASGQNTGRELWKTDGTAAGTVLVKDINPGSADGNPLRFAALNGIALFRANDGTVGSELWRSDGSEAGTWLVKDIDPGSGSSEPEGFITAAGQVYFTAANPEHGTELWRTDGTAAGTALVADIEPGPAGSFPAGLTDLDGLLYFTATDSAGGTELWMTDGTEEGTQRVADLVPGPEGSSPESLTAVNGRLHFVADDGTHGAEVWGIDGAGGVPALVIDLNPGTASSDPESLTAASDALCFEADDGIAGRELWASDGSAAGTFLVKDIAPGPLGSLPANLVYTGTTLYFSADAHDEEGIGAELWKAPLAALDITSPTVVAVRVRAGNVIDVEFSESQGSGATTAANFVLSGSGQGSLAVHPDSVVVVGRKTCRLRWIGGSMVADGDLTVTVNHTVQDLAGNTLGFPDSGTDFGGGLGTRPVSVAPLATSTVVTSGAGMLVEDLNLDGIADVLILDGGNHDGTLYPGDGAGSFQFPTDLGSSGMTPRGAAAGDFDRDGFPELVVANEGSDSVGWYYSFGSVRQSIAVGSAPHAVAAGDFTGDGHSDFATADSGSNTVTLITFEKPNEWTVAPTLVGTYAVGSGPSALVKGDFNRDGRLDLACANTDSHDISILLGNDAGGFGPILTIPISGVSPVAITSADVDGDGRLDLITANRDSHDVSILMGSAIGMFQSGVDLPAGAEPSGVAAADLDRDGKLDLAVTNAGSSSLYLFLGTGDGAFLSPGQVTVGTGAIAVGAADLDRDGDPDLVVANEPLGTLETFRNGTLHRSAVFGEPTTATEGLSEPRSLVQGDLNRDGRPDLVVATASPSGVSVYLGNEAGGFDQGASIGYGTEPQELALADFNRDGKPDLLVTESADPSVSLRLGDGSGGFAPAQVPVPEFEAVAPAVADFDRDGKLDLVGTVGSGPVYAAFWRGDGAGGFDDSGSSMTIPQPSAMAAAEVISTSFNPGPELIVLSAETTDVLVLPFSWAGVFDGTSTAQGTGVFGDSITVGNQDGNFLHDLFIPDSETGQIAKLQGTSFGVDGLRLYQTGGSPGRPVLADLNDDGFPDMIVTDETSESLAILPGRSGGEFGAAQVYPVQGSAVAVAAGDFNRDGQAELFSADTETNNLVRHPNLGGHFALQTVPVGVTEFSRAVPTAVFRITASHRGPVTDTPIRLTSFHLGFSDAEDTTLTSEQVNALVANLEIRKDSNGNSVYEEGTDAAVASAAPLALDADGRQHVDLPSESVAALVPGAGSASYFVVVTTQSDAELQSPSTLRLTHVTSASSRAEDPAIEVPLTLEFTPDVISPAAVALPVRLSGFGVE